LGFVVFGSDGLDLKAGDQCEFRSEAEKERIEAGSRTLSRFGVVDEQIYLVIRDLTQPGAQLDNTLFYVYC